MQSRRRFLQTLAATPAVVAAPALLAMEPQPEPEYGPAFDSAEYSCGLIWVETDFDVYIHKATYSWHQWDWAKEELVRMNFVQRDFGLPGQCFPVCEDPKFCIPFTARNGRGYLNIAFNEGYKRTEITHTRRWAFKDLHELDENKAYWKRIVVA